MAERDNKNQPMIWLANRYCPLSPSIFFYLLLSPSQYHNVPFPILLLTVVNYFKAGG
jgi:hypothetical protein